MKGVTSPKRVILVIYYIKFEEISWQRHLVSRSLNENKDNSEKKFHVRIRGRSKVDSLGVALCSSGLTMGSMGAAMGVG